MRHYAITVCFAYQELWIPLLNPSNILNYPFHPNLASRLLKILMPWTLPPIDQHPPMDDYAIAYQAYFKGKSLEWSTLHDLIRTGRESHRVKTQLCSANGGQTQAAASEATTAPPASTPAAASTPLPQIAKNKQHLHRDASLSLSGFVVGTIVSVTLALTKVPFPEKITSINMIIWLAIMLAGPLVLSLLGLMVSKLLGQSSGTPKISGGAHSPTSGNQLSPANQQHTNTTSNHQDQTAQYYALGSNI
jgi:hypothetical protein